MAANYCIVSKDKKKVSFGGTTSYRIDPYYEYTAIGHPIITKHRSQHSRFSYCKKYLRLNSIQLIHVKVSGYRRVVLQFFPRSHPLAFGTLSLSKCWTGRSCHNISIFRIVIIWYRLIDLRDTTYTSYRKEYTATSAYSKSAFLAFSTPVL